MNHSQGFRIVSLVQAVPLYLSYRGYWEASRGMAEHFETQEAAHKRLHEIQFRDSRLDAEDRMHPAVEAITGAKS